MNVEYTPTDAELLSYLRDWAETEDRIGREHDFMFVHDRLAELSTSRDRAHPGDYASAVEYADTHIGDYNIEDRSQVEGHVRIYQDPRDLLRDGYAAGAQNSQSNGVDK